MSEVTHSVTPTLYLGGSIRNGVADDIEWRQEARECLSSVWVILDPMNGKVYHGADEVRGGRTYEGVLNEWTFGNGLHTMSDKQIYYQDKRDVAACDAGLWNLTALTNGYPCTGSTAEITWAADWGKLVYIIHPEPEKLHPFLLVPAAVVFYSPDEAFDFLEDYGEKISGLPVRIYG